MSEGHKRERETGRVEDREEREAETKNEGDKEKYRGRNRE